MRKSIDSEHQQEKSDDSGLAVQENLHATDFSIDPALGRARVCVSESP